MAKTKAELETDFTRYTAIVNEALAVLASHDIASAISRSVAAWDYIDGMMQYERRYNKTELDSVGAIDVVLDHAPLVFDVASLDRVDALLKSQRSVERRTTTSIGDRLVAAREAMREAAQIWDRFTRGDDDVPADEWRRLNCGRSIWDSVMRLWLAAGLIQPAARESGQAYRWATRMDRITSAKCSACGVVARGPKHRLLDNARCPACGGKVPFVVIPDAC